MGGMWDGLLTALNAMHCLKGLMVVSEDVQARLVKATVAAWDGRSSGIQLL